MAAEAGASWVPPTESGAAILVVDDSLPKRLAIAAAIESLGHTVVDAESGEAGLQAVIQRDFAVILMDVQMPGMDGYETTRLIRQRERSQHTPVIFITAYAIDEVELPAAYESGAIDFIFAPIVPEILRAKVSIFVDLFLKSRELEQSLRDVTVLSDEFRDNEARARSVLDHVAEGIITLGSEGNIESFNRAASDLFGYTEREAVGQPFALMVGPTEPDAVAEERPGSSSAESTGRRKDGSTFPMELDLSEVELGTRTVHIGCLRDISERQSYTEALQYVALHDALTNLPNRTLFGDRVNHAIRGAVREGHSLALMVLDLDDFKQVNDTLGHQHGDLLLRQVADRLTASLRDGDTVARLGGDEFGILPVGDTDLAGAASVAWTLQKTLEPAFVVEGHSVDVKASIGITLVPEHGDNIDDLLRRADLAMYDAKGSGAGYAMFAAEQEDAPARRLALLSSLRDCVEREELVLHYQPKIDLVTRQTVGVEALIRWNHPSGRLVMPDEFIPEVENSDLMIPITEWVINESLRTLHAWRSRGCDLTMAVNLGARCLTEDSGLLETAERLTAGWGIPAEKLIFELTEGALIDTAAPGLLPRLEAMAAQLSIDDFGTGYSSLAYLQQLPVLEIKADRSFVSSMSSVRDDAVFVRSTIDLAHNLGLRVVAEGVENEPTMALLTSYGCDEAQGYYFSRPIPATEMLEWLDSNEFGCRERHPALQSARATGLEPATLA